MIEMEEMNNNLMKTRQNLQYFISYFTENNTGTVIRKTNWRQQCWYTAVVSNNYLANQHQIIN